MYHLPKPYTLNLTHFLLHIYSAVVLNVVLNIEGAISFTVCHINLLLKRSKYVVLHAMIVVNLQHVLAEGLTRTPVPVPVMKS